MKKKILIVNQNSGYLTIDVANTFAEQYDDVVVMYGLNRITERLFHPKIKIQKSIVYNRSSTLMRLWTWGIFTLHLFLLLLWKYRDYTILYYSNPPLSFFNSLIFSNIFSIVVFDTYPDALKLIGIKETSFIYKLWVAVNKKVFTSAHQIITLSEGMKKQLMHYVKESKVKVVPIWPASENFRPIPKNENPFLVEHGWQYKFIVLYSGNMGIGHKLEVLIDVAETLKNNDQILFLFIGEGAKKRILQTLTIQKELLNVHFLTWQDATVLPYSLASADVAVVAVEPEATNASVPSKTFNYIAVGAPLLGIGSSGSELESLILRHSIGVYVCGSNTNAPRKFVRDLFKDREKLNMISNNALKASKEFSYKQAIEYLF